MKNRTTGRWAVAGLAAIALTAGALPVLLLTGNGSRDAVSRSAAVGRTWALAGESAQNRLLAVSKSWADKAGHALDVIDRQLSALIQGERELDAVPVGQRSTRPGALLYRIHLRITWLTSQRASLSARLTTWGMYQRLTLELAGVRTELGYLRATRQPARQASPTSLTSRLSGVQENLTGQVDALTGELRKAIAQPVVAVPVTPLPSQVGGVLNRTLADAPEPAPASSAPVSPAAPARSGAAPRAIQRLRLQVSLATVPGNLPAVEEAGRAAISDESRILGMPGITVRLSPASAVTAPLEPTETPRPHPQSLTRARLVRASSLNRLLARLLLWVRSEARLARAIPNSPGGGN